MPAPPVVADAPLAHPVDPKASSEMAILSDAAPDNLRFVDFASVGTTVAELPVIISGDGAEQSASTTSSSTAKQLERAARRRLRRRKMACCTVSCLVILGLIVWLWMQFARALVSVLIDFGREMNDLGAVGVIVVVIALLVSSFPWLPHQAIRLVCGFVYGWWSLAIIYLSCLAGAGAVFLISRSCFAAALLKKVPKQVRAVTESIAGSSESLRISTLVVLSPIPFAWVNVGLAVAKVPFKTFMIATAIGIIPSVVIDTYFGKTAHDLASALDGSKSFTGPQIAGLVIGLTSAVLVVALVTRAAKTELEKISMHQQAIDAEAPIPPQ
eukprot:TRINITY_DN2130_c0_g1_i4.p1 TRINITY_DN2130_c0_g1~~TRINITY_DN2130_c0_g1_i4.p1  ORF type:complete len:334 (+),score=60.01 TRINITY_DN2130_c0_g1_i4:22-1002(+)